MGLLDEYIETDALYKRKYGPATALFLQCGDFFELYAVINDTEEVGADIYKIGDLCDLQVTRKNKAILQNNRSNPLMAGFPMYALTKHASALLALNYTVVIMRQVTPPPNVTRAVTEIMSPGVTPMPTSHESQYLMVVFFSEDLLTVGIAGVDVSTGHTFVQDAATPLVVAGSAGGASSGGGGGGGAPISIPASDDVARAIQAWNPREIAVYARRPTTGAGAGAGAAVLATRRRALERIFANARTHLCWENYDPDLERPTIQNGVLKRAYWRPDGAAAADDAGGAADERRLRALGAVSYIEKLDLERMDLGRMAFVLLLEFTYLHSETLVQSLKEPARLERNGVLSLEYTSAVQLNLIGDGGGGGLVRLLNRCGTAFGRRLFRERLMNPVADAAVMTARYDAISAILQARSQVPLSKILSQMLDLERMARRIRIGTFPPCDWAGFYMSLEAADSAADIGGKPDIVAMIAEIRTRYGDALRLNECGRYFTSDIRSNIFAEGAYPDLDAHQVAITQQFVFLTERCDALPGCKIDSNERDGYFLSVTKRRWEAIPAPHRILVLGEARLTAKPISASSAVLRVTSATVSAASETILRHQRELGADAERHYRAFLTKFTEDVGDTLDQLVAGLADLDVTVAAARNAADYGYVRPVPAPGAPGGTSSASGLDARGLRHPIIERIQTETDYVANDVCIGSAAAHGWLLYGINASGKSSLMKAIGLNVILAQAGMFVSATSFRFTPYERLFTRIQMNDNIYRGMSSFTVEMSELRTILARADPQSLVLGDELCSGTESVSAVAIVASGIERLLATGATFVFATHLHELGDISVVTEAVAAGTVFIGHLHTEANAAADGGLVYDRKIQPGPGNPLYGLEVCRGLGMDDAFLRTADRVRRQMLGVAETLRAGLRTSAYNRAVLVDACGVCSAPATETHHIRYQRDADKAGRVGNGVGVHRASNLIPLCEACHQEEHHGNLKIHGYRATVGGGCVLDLTRTTTKAPAPAPAAVAAACSDITWLRYAQTGWMIQGKKNWLPRTEVQVRALAKKKLDISSEQIDKLLNDVRERWLETTD